MAGEVLHQSLLPSGDCEGVVTGGMVSILNSVIFGTSVLPAISADQN